MYHYNYKIELHTNYTFFKHNFMTKPPYPRPIPSPPSSAKNTAKKFVFQFGDCYLFLILNIEQIIFLIAYFIRIIKLIRFLIEF